MAGGTSSTYQPRELALIFVPLLLAVLFAFWLHGMLFGVRPFG